MDRRICRIARAVEAGFSGTEVWVRRYSSIRNPDIKWYLKILNCPARVADRAVELAIHLAIELWRGRDPIFIGSVSPRNTRHYFADRADPSSPWKRPTARLRRIAAPRTRGRPRAGGVRV